jgi:hypothetical protein
MSKMMQTLERWSWIFHAQNVGYEAQESIYEAMKRDHVVAVFGASDDLLEFRGAINDELGAWEGTECWITPNGTLIDTENLAKSYESNGVALIHINAEWCPSDADMNWRIRTSAPHAIFELLNDDDSSRVFCLGVVFFVGRHNV